MSKVKQPSGFRRSLILFAKVLSPLTCLANLVLHKKRFKEVSAPIEFLWRFSSYAFPNLFMLG